MAQNRVPSNDVWDYIRTLERRLEAVEGRTHRNVVIPEGGVRITNDGELIVQTASGAYTFYLIQGGDGQREFGVTRDNGSFVIRTFSVVGGAQAWALHDNGNGIVVSDDAASGQGLARPALTWPTRRVRFDSLPNTDSTTFDPVLDTAFAYKSHPRAFAQVVHCVTTSGTTGEARLMLDGVQVGTTIPVAFSVGFANVGPFDVPGTHMSQHRLVLECRRTGGTGRVGADMVVRVEQT
ncbi:hypothetical protein [Saccharothrix lopnurensis]|uniref:Uncharacterized protein n=1 Tax=Saccharothrix lopnurensis TaxID=1670621 RepID=A0ABW1P809_9PSEU